MHLVGGLVVLGGDEGDVGSTGHLRASWADCFGVTVLAIGFST